MFLQECFCRNVFAGDRKSTRLNSSHSQISYAVFCLKKKTGDIAHPGVHPVARPAGGLLQAACRNRQEEVCTSVSRPVAKAPRRRDMTHQSTRKERG